MALIQFTKIYSSKGALSLEATLDNGDSFPLIFSWNHPTEIDFDRLAALLSSFCGIAYSEIYFDFPVSVEMIKRVAEFTKAKVESSEENHLTLPRKRSGHVLSFSGGFDSLAAKALMPIDTHLVSIDFGGRFHRESIFFERFNPFVVETNLVETPFRQNSWTFMSLGAIIADATLNSRYHTFGTILEAFPDSFAHNQGVVQNFTPLPLEMIGVENAPYVLGLSEAATLKIVLQSDRALLNDALISLASPREEKLHRKKMLATAVAQRLGTSLNLPEIESPLKPHFSFGEVFSVDLIALYVGWALGKQVADTMVRDLPESALNEVNASGMDFMEHWNPNLYESFPTELYPSLVHKLASFGLHPYTEQNWEQLAIIRRILNKHL